MPKKLKNITAALLCAAMLSGCYGNGGAAEETEDTSATQASSVTTAAAAADVLSESSPSAAALASEDEPSARKAESRPLTIALDSVNTDYSPFDDIDTCTSLVNKMTGVTLIGHTRAGNRVMNGKTAVTEQFGGKMYVYSGIADTTVSYDPSQDTTSYRFDLRNDVKFSDGETLDADDVIFTLYLHLDPSYEGSCRLHDADILGALNYRYDSAGAEGVTNAQIEAALATDEMKAIIKEKITVPTLRAQYETVKTLYDDSSYSIYTQKFPRAPELFAFFYSINSEYSARGKDGETVISDIADMYGGNYRQLASMTAGDETVFDDEALSLAVGYITGNSDSNAGRVSSVPGIVKNDSFSLTVTVQGSGETLEKTLADMVILPMHCYGNPAMYNYNGGMFGFIKGKAADVVSALPEKLVGAGAFVVSGKEDGALLLEANMNYYKGAPASETVKIIRTGAEDHAALIADGTADICSAGGSANSFESVNEVNRSMEKIYPAVSTEAGYGYIGINAKNVRLGDEFSEKSYALRKGLATAISSFRDKSVSEYYGGFGITTDYPYLEEIVVDSGTEGYKTPYSVNNNGDPIVLSGMNDDERREAVKNACLGFFSAAGYTVSDGKVTSAPYNGKLEFSALIAAGGSGDHPAYRALADAAELLSEIGITLNITDTADAGVLWESLNSGTNEIWAGAWNSETLSKAYIDSYYGIEGSTKLKKLIADAETKPDTDKPAAYMLCYNKIVNEYAVEIPMYRRTACTLFSTLRIDVATVPDDMTDFYDWTDEIANIVPKQ